MTKKLRRLAALGVLVAALAATPVLADPLYLAVDVPTRLGASTFTPNQIVRFEAGAYSVVADLPQDVRILALDRADDGRWLFVPSAPVTLGASEYTARDVLSTNGATFARVFDGAAAGIPADARIDALLPDGPGAWILSFDVPVTLGGTDYSRSDLVRFDGAFARVWNAASAGVPAYANVVGVGRSGAGFVVSFDVPARIGGTEVLPGQIMRTAAESVALFSADAAWPPASQLRDFAVAVAQPAGAVPDNGHTPGVPLTLAKGPASSLTLQWDAACGAGATDYAVYQGSLGAWSAATPAACSTSGARSWSGPVPAGNVFFLIVPRSATLEGSYGRRSDGSERPVSPAACVPREPAGCDGP